MLVILGTWSLFVLFYKIGSHGSDLIPIHNLLNTSTVVNEHEYQLLINPHVSKCTRNDLILTAIVSIAPGFFDRRKLIRETWASVNDSRLLVLFALGSTLEPAVNNLVYQESVLFNDIIQESFIDSYKNFTLKTIMTLKWVSTYCNNTRFVLRINDDVVVNVPYLLKRL